MTTSQLIGYGPFHLEQFRGDEDFARFDGTLGTVCEHQPFRTLNPTPPQLLCPDHVLVCIHAGTRNATKVLLHRRAIVHAVTPEQARLIEARSHERTDP